MFVPVPIVIVTALVLLLMIAQIMRLSRRRDPLLGGSSSSFRPTAVTGHKVSPVAPVATLPPEIDLQVRALIARGRKIEAIKLVRDATHLGLKDSKDLVEAL